MTVQFRRALPLAATLLAATLLAACVPAASLPATCSDPAVTLEATLVEERLEPATLEVCRDQQVTLNVEIRRDAILHLHGYDDQVAARQVRAGETVELSFEAVRAGQFPLAIHTTDGPAEATVGTLTVHER